VFLRFETDTDQLALKSREEGVEDKCLRSKKKKKARLTKCYRIGNIGWPIESLFIKFVFYIKSIPSSSQDGGQRSGAHGEYRHLRHSND